MDNRLCFVLLIVHEPSYYCFGRTLLLVGKTIVRSIDLRTFTLNEKNARTNS